MLAIIGFALFYLAAANGVLAFNLGTCTQGSADELLGGATSLALYLVSVLCLNIAKPVRVAYTAILPALFLLAWQLSFSLRLAYGYLHKGMSACEVMHDLGYELDGREPFFAGLWLTMCFIPLSGLAIAFYRGRSS